MKKIIATVIIVLAVMFTPQGVYADSEEQNNEYYDRLISEINEGLSFEGDEDVKTVMAISNDVPDKLPKKVTPKKHYKEDDEQVDIATNKSSLEDWRCK